MLIILFVYFVISGWELSDVVGNSSRTKENEKESSMDQERNRCVSVLFFGRIIHRMYGKLTTCMHGSVECV